MIPQTPPRSSKRVTLQTPQETPQNIINKKFKSNLINEDTPKKDGKLVYHTPVSVKKDGKLFTPASLKKDEMIEKPNNLPLLSTNLFKLTNEDSKDTGLTKKSHNFGLLLPLPSNIGKGRKSKVNKKISTNNRLNLDFFKNINQDFQFEQDLVEEHERKLQEEASFPLSASSKQFMIKSNNISKELFNREIEEDDDDEEEAEVDIDDEDDDDEDEYKPDEHDLDHEHKHKHDKKLPKSTKNFNEESIFNPKQISIQNTNIPQQFPNFNPNASQNTMHAPQNTSNNYGQNVPMNYYPNALINYGQNINYNQNMYGQNTYGQNIIYTQNAPIDYAQQSQAINYAPPYNTTPQTPGKQVITQDLINDWYRETPKYEQSNYDNIKATQLELPNPFIDNKENKQNTFNISDSNLSNSNQINYATHMEKINNKTGERIVEELSSNQQAIKPKKLDFSQFK